MFVDSVESTTFAYNKNLKCSLPKNYTKIKYQRRQKSHISPHLPLCSSRCKWPPSPLSPFHRASPYRSLPRTPVPWSRTSPCRNPRSSLHGTWRTHPTTPRTGTRRETCRGATRGPGPPRGLPRSFWEERGRLGPCSWSWPCTPAQSFLLRCFPSCATEHQLCDPNTRSSSQLPRSLCCSFQWN